MKVKELLSLLKSSEFETLSNRKNTVRTKLSSFGDMDWAGRHKNIVFEILSEGEMVTERYGTVEEIPQEIMEASLLKINKIKLDIEERTSWSNNEYIFDDSKIILTIFKQ